MLVKLKGAASNGAFGNLLYEIPLLVRVLAFDLP
jgi:hypothetical protein